MLIFGLGVQYPLNVTWNPGYTWSDPNSHTTILSSLNVAMLQCGVGKSSDEARAFPGGQLAHPEGQNEDKNEENLRKNKEKRWKFEKK